MNDQHQDKPADLTPKGAHEAPFGILLVNLGSPDAPTVDAVRRFLAEFLSDSRVVSIPKFIWWPILHGIVLRVRPSKVAHAYQMIWRNESPLIEITKAQAAELQTQVREHIHPQISVEVGMRYGNPSLKTGLLNLRKAGVHRVLVVPLYPQFSVSTVATVFDKISELFRSCWHIPALRYTPAYFAHSAYISALADSVRHHWQTQGRAEHLIISFHGLPTRYSRRGDPYEAQCRITAQLIAKELQLTEGEWSLAFQSRFGKDEWLQPYLEPLVRGKASIGLKSLDVICPGFSADCLETLEEISVRTKEVFLEAGGQKLNYIPALNHQTNHIAMMLSLVQNESKGWV